MAEPLGFRVFRYTDANEFSRNCGGNCQSATYPTRALRHHRFLLWPNVGPQIADGAETILIAITNADIFIPDVNWRFAFAARSYNRIAVVSAARMWPPSVQ